MSDTLVHEMWGVGNFEGARERNSPLFVGLECEVESVARPSEGSHRFRVTTDGSLRNHGVEFISDPTPITEIVDDFTLLHRVAEFRDLSAKFSPRTSIHVHVNCSNLSLLETRNIVYMYALFEEFFFLLVDSSRRSNIHCVPLTETYLPVYYKSELTHLISRWHKYTALNIKPLCELGTIEFRHMQGHDDPELLKTWLGTINRLVSMATFNPINRNTLTDDNIRLWFREIFADTRVKNMEGMVSDVCFNSILDMKLAVM
jgi:hypothetical protein